MRVGLLTNIPSPYRLSYYKVLRSFCDLFVIFDRDNEPNRLWKTGADLQQIPHQILNSIMIPYVRRRPDVGMSDTRFIHVSPGLFRALWRFRPDVIMSGELGARSLMAALYCRARGIPLILGFEGTLHTEAVISRLRLSLRRFLVKTATRFWSNGAASTELLVAYGAERECVDDGMTGVDTRFFRDRVRHHLVERDRLRDELQLQGTVFLYLGQFVPRKGVTLLAEALASLRDDAIPRFSVIFAGDGPERESLARRLATNKRLTTVFTGFLQQDDLPKYLALADVFVLPSLEDNWSLATLEASVAGLPQIYSKYNGASADLMATGCAGRMVDPMDLASLSAALRDYALKTPQRLDDSVVSTVTEYYSSQRQAERAWQSISRTVDDFRAQARRRPPIAAAWRRGDPSRKG